MSCCPPPRGYEKLFGARSARRDAKRYRRDGLDETAEEMVGFLRERGVEGASVLEIGGGVGAIEVELLRAGAAHAVDVELSPYYEETARELWDEEGVGDRAEYVVANVAADGKEVAPADVVVMHRVVCCYPDYDALVGAAAERANGCLVMSFPRPRVLIRAGLWLLNVGAWILRWEYRSWVHPPEALIAAAGRRGLTPVFDWRGRTWQVAALERK
ncbi:MAG TPA: methyltransferase domain-containing protein [Gaiellaceae bacterium]|jgi:magnesium-protoporphyrin O-methyltransferase|nr:methyltransferase domain-containing protein [Gaiellaceae bacterium]